MRQADDGIAERRHQLRNAATAHLGPSLIDCHIAAPMDRVLDRPMLTDQAQQSRGTSLVRAQAGDPLDHLGALLPGFLPGGAALQLEDLGEAGPVAVPHQRRAGGQAPLLNAAVPGVHRLDGG